MNAIDTYFKLSDTAGSNRDDFNNLIALFDPNGTIEPANGPSFTGRQEITNFFHRFFEKNIKLRHVWITKEQEGSYKTTWAVAGLRKDGHVVSLEGTDYAKLNKDGLISHLKVVING
ncbi:nuclear transport factor 2 family protein [Sporolactobacillus putidus]|uniref:SnoaL-like domain-containing protein n=1 Tax=Sporolactobacillus putidus TaxID=492735 RepID=A0A917S6M7_9BACL|nr:nuclear transport factor 2 family protein [Sporolactobacillus putidus]GGL61902.1 hypothetical protein GCM10007968_27360 [Sporolactobacillus putidus]